MLDDAEIAAVTRRSADGGCAETRTDQGQAVERRREPVSRGVRTVPSLPSVVIKLQQYLNQPMSASMRWPSDRIRSGLTANVLQLSNSAYFGWSRSIRTVKEAIDGWAPTASSRSCCACRWPRWCASRSRATT